MFNEAMNFNQWSIRSKNNDKYQHSGVWYTTEMIVKVKFNYIAIYIMHVQCRYITTEHIGTTCVHFLSYRTYVVP